MSSYNKEFRITNDAQRKWVIQTIADLPEGEEFFVSISKQEKKRSIEQNKLYWKWVGEIADSLYDDRSRMHSYLKEHILLPIMRRDFPDVEQMVKSVKALRKGGHPQADLWKNTVLEWMVSTTRLSVKQFTEYLEDVEKWASGMQIVLTKPERENENG